MKYITICILLAVNVSCSSHKKNQAESVMNPLTAVSDIHFYNAEKRNFIKYSHVLFENGKVTGLFNGEPGSDESLLMRAQVINGKGGYLLPSFIDMHVHITDSSEPEKYLRYGITYVRVMSETYGIGYLMGFPHIKSLKEKLEKGEISGASLITAGPVLDGEPLTSPAMKKITGAKEAETAVKEIAGDNYDFIKIYDNLSEDSWRAVVSACRENNIPFAGHIPYSVRVQDAVNNGIWSIEHLTGYYSNDTAEFLVSEQDIKNILKNDLFKKVYHVPTLVAIANLQDKNDFSRYFEDPETSSLGFLMRFHWYMTHNAFYSNAEKAYSRLGSGYRDRVLSDLMKLTKQLYDAGIPVLAGTDANFVGVLPGISFHQELGLLVKAGIPASDVIYSAAIESRKALSVLNRFKERDLYRDWVILEKNPLNDINNTLSVIYTLQNGKIVYKKN